MAVYEKMMTMKVKAKYSFGFCLQKQHTRMSSDAERKKTKKCSKPLKSLFSYGAKYQLKLALQLWNFNHFRFLFYFILTHFLYLTFQLSSCAGISRSRCFLQPSIWMKMLISNSLRLQEKWAHKVVVAEEYSICNCCSVDLKEWLNTIQYVH